MYFTEGEATRALLFFKAMAAEKIQAPETTAATAAVRTRRTAPATTAAKTLTIPKKQPQQH